MANIWQTRLTLWYKQLIFIYIFFTIPMERIYSKDHSKSPNCEDAFVITKLNDLPSF